MALRRLHSRSTLGHADDRRRPFAAVVLTLLVGLIAGPDAGRASDDPFARPPPEAPPTPGFICERLTPPTSGDLPLPATECEALVELHDLLGGSAWPPYYGSWGEDPNICDRWPGITCEVIDGRWHVTSLDLHDSGLRGALGRQVDLDDQELKTPGRSLAKLTELHHLRLSQNDLTGTIPVELGGLRSLRSIILDHNRLSGAIPSALADLPDLVSLSVAGNQLTGRIPEGLLGSSCPGCADADRYGMLMLTGNELSGPLPSDLGRNEVSTIDFRLNADLVGPIPDSYASIGDVDLFGYMGTGICDPPSPSVAAWLDGVRSVLRPPRSECPAATPAVPVDDANPTDGVATSDDTEIDAVLVGAQRDAYQGLLSRFVDRREALIDSADQIDSGDRARDVSLLADAYAAYGRVADEYASELTELEFPPDVRPLVDALVEASVREARTWAEHATDREAIAAGVPGLTTSATRARQEAERVLLSALGRLIDD